MSEQHYREIITKAVCGKGRKYSKTTHTICPQHKPTSILGCWVINHRYDAVRKGDSIQIKGTYDINVWYSYEKNTKTDVATNTVSYHESIPLKMRPDELITDELDVIARSTKQPHTLEALIAENGTDVNVEVEKEFAAEVVGETKVCVLVHPDKEDAHYQDVKWSEEVSDQELKDSIDPKFLERRPPREFGGRKRGERGERGERDRFEHAERDRFEHHDRDRDRDKDRDHQKEEKFEDKKS
ncbi:outer spore coat protein CotE [Geomicrobium sp. JCM 19055]|uniref:outer spore coat protein CotE n=1 Tax=Geomicrobium sp. JCM 19055 TaxID=1460649 RepID=UPI00045ED2E4|nr:outer spore coat protein E [Geomicrobium sp. JCM 19055]